MPFYMPPPRVSSNPLLYDAIKQLGLTANLKLCLDAGDAESYPGSGQTWFDRSGGGYDFYRGTTSGSDSTDPTFNGTAGMPVQGTKWTFDGGDGFKYDQATNETWMQNLGKAGGGATILWGGYMGSASNADIIGTQTGTTGSSRGFDLYYDAAQTRFLWNFVRSTDVLNNAGGSGPAQTGLPKWAIVGWAIDKTAGAVGYTVNVNGTSGSNSGIGETITSNNAASVMSLASKTGGTASFFPSAWAFSFIAVWEAKLTDANLDALWTALRGRFGL